jgi:hypothetical protein
LILDCQWVEDLPIEPHDVPLDGVVSPAKEIHHRGTKDKKRFTAEGAESGKDGDESIGR